jgi:hypothetical protein
MYVLYQNLDLLSTKIFAIVTLASRVSEPTDIAALVFPAKQTASSPANVSTTVTDSLLIYLAVEQHSHMVATVDATNGDFMLALANETPLHSDDLFVTLSHVLLRISNLEIV